MITAKEAFALSKDKITVRETLNKIGALIETIAKNGECKMWYKLSFISREMVKEVIKELEELGYEVRYALYNGTYMLRISWGE